MTKKKDYKLFQGRDLSSGLHITKILWNGRGWNKGRKKESLHPQHQASCQKQGRDFILLWNGRKSNHEITYWKREMKDMEQLLRQANVNYNSAEFLPGPLKVLGHTHTHSLSLSHTHTHTLSHTHTLFRACIMIRLSLQRRSWESHSWPSGAGALCLWELWFLGLRVGIFLLGKTQVTGKTGHDFFFFFFLMRMWPQLFRDWENSYLPLKYACLLRHHLGIVPAGKGQKHLCSGS